MAPLSPADPRRVLARRGEPTWGPGWPLTCRRLCGARAVPIQVWPASAAHLSSPTPSPGHAHCLEGLVSQVPGSLTARWAGVEDQAGASPRHRGQSRQALPLQLPGPGLLQGCGLGSGAWSGGCRCWDLTQGLAGRRELSRSCFHSHWELVAPAGSSWRLETGRARPGTWLGRPRCRACVKGEDRAGLEGQARCAAPPPPTGGVQLRRQPEASCPSQATPSPVLPAMQGCQLRSDSEAHASAWDAVCCRPLCPLLLSWPRDELVGWPPALVWGPLPGFSLPGPLPPAKCRQPPGKVVSQHVVDGNWLGCWAQPLQHPLELPRPALGHVHQPLL